tara:strand:+ start:4103 stop:4843 length:741 start_codon:yes stop_codon:yes gene_type:complete
MKVAVLIPATSLRRDWSEFKDTDLFRNVFKSFFTTYDLNHNYTFYIGIDEDDKLYNNETVIKEIKKFISVMKNSEIKIIKFNKNYKGKPTHIWNELYEISLNENDFFLQVGSDIEFVDKNWCECMINILKENNEIGVVGLTDLGRYEINKNDTLLTQTMVSKRHHEIFGFYFPYEIENWFCDNWIGDIYDRYGRKFIVNQRILNLGGEPRYDIPNDCKEKYNICMIKYSKKIQKYQKQLNFYKRKF